MSTPGAVDRIHEGGGLRLTTTDHGGDGPPLVLMPGLGLRRGSLHRLAGRLTGWHVVTMDLRGHGGSATAPWTFEVAVDDVRHVVDDYGFDHPYVGGHSLGGMLALRYALAGHPVSGAVNVDGWGPGVEHRFPGEDPAVVARRLDDYATGALPSRLATAITARSRQAREGTMRQVLALLRHADVVAWHRDAPCRSLAVHAVAPPSRTVARVLGKDMIRMQAAHHRGLQRDLAALAAERPDVTVVEVDATHALYRTRTALVAAAMDEFAGVNG